MPFLESLGLYSAFTAGTAIAVRPIIAEWIRVRIAAGVDEQVKTRLASLQLTLDKDLEEHRSVLAVEAERVRSLLARTSTDFAIYASRRHDAIAALFAEYLQAEVHAITFPSLPVGQDTPDLHQAMFPKVLEARERAYAAYAKHVLYLPSSLDAVAQEARGAFHDLLVEYIAPAEGVFAAQTQAKRALRSALESFQEAARAELSRSAEDQPGFRVRTS